METRCTSASPARTTRCGVSPGRKDDDAIYEDEVVELFLDPSGAGRWRMNLYRLETHNRQRVVEGSGFSPPLRGDFHTLDRFGWLELVR